MNTEIQFYKNGLTITKVLKGDKLNFIKDRISKRKTKNMILEVNTYSLETFETTSSLRF